MEAGMGASQRKQSTLGPSLFGSMPTQWPWNHSRHPSHSIIHAIRFCSSCHASSSAFFIATCEARRF